MLRGFSFFFFSLSNVFIFLSPTKLQSGWRPEVAKNPFSQSSSMANRVAYTSPGVATSSLVLPQVTAANLIPPQQVAAAMHTYSREKQLPSIVPSVHHSLPTNSPARQTPASEIGLTKRNIPTMGLHNFSTAAGHSALRMENTSNIKPVTLNTPGRELASFTSQSTRSQTYSQSLHPSNILSEPRPPAHLYPSRPPMGDLDPVPDSWRASQGLPPNYHSQANQNNYNALVGGSRQPGLQPGPSLERNEYVVGEEFESWSPDNSPSRTTDYMMGRNFPESRMNPGWDYRPDRSRQRNFSGHRGHNRYGDRKWRDRRH